MTRPPDQLPQTDLTARLQAWLAPRYRLERESGRGAGSLRYLAHDLEQDHPVILQIVRPDVAATVDRARFLEELAAAARLKHPQLLPILDSGAADPDDGTSALYLVRPQVTGESLRTRIDREGLLPVAESLRIAADAAAALAAAHRRGIVHGDLTPDSILISGGGGVAVLADLGDARAIRAAGGGIASDRRYLSPEQAAGEAPDARSDVYALGLILYEMLAGEPARSPIVPLRAGRRAVAEDVELIVAQALSAEPAHRFQSAEELATALGSAAATAGRPVFTTAERLAPRPRISPRWAFFSTAVVGVLGVSLWLRYTAVPPATPPAPPPPNSIAVLPLVNASPDTANEYLSDGLTGELISALGTVPGLRVAGPSASWAFKSSSIDAQRAGRRLGVGAVLEGSVRPSGSRLRVTAHLVSVQQGFDIWSETYERDTSELFAVQDELVQDVLAALQVHGQGRARTGLSSDSMPRTSLEAYGVYLRGRALAARRGTASLPAAIGFFEDAIRIDSTYAPAWIGLADARARAMLDDDRPTAEAAPAVREAAERALALDSTAAPAHIALGLVLFVRERDWAAAERELQRAIELNPNLPDGYHWYSHLLTALNRTPESLEASQRALELSPVDPALVTHLGWHYLHSGEYDAASASLARAVAQAPGAPDSHYLLARLAETLGDYTAAEEHLARMLPDAAARPAVRAELGRIVALAGRTDEARGMLADLRETAKTAYVSSYDLAHLSLALGDVARSLALLEEAATDREEDIVYLRVDPRLERLRQDRRFVRVARRVGLP